MRLHDLKEPDILLMKQWATDGMSSMEPDDKKRLSKLANALGSGGVRGQDCRDYALSYEFEVPEPEIPDIDRPAEADDPPAKRRPGRPKKVASTDG